MKKKYREKLEKKIKKHNLTAYFWPDWTIDWGIRAFIKAACMIFRNRYDVIITISSPVTTNLVGYLLSKIFRIPWAAEFRDGWLYDPDIFKPPTKLHRLLHVKLASLMVKQGSSIWHVTPRLAELFQKKYPQYANKILCFPLGFDDKLIQLPSAAKMDDHFNIVYAGNFYPHTSDPKILLEPLSELLAEKPELRKTFRINIIGHNSRIVAFELGNYDLGDIIKFYKPMSYTDLINFIKTQSLALIICVGSPYCNVRFSSKIFDYIVAGKPILALVEKDSSIESLIAKTGMGWPVYGRDKAKVKEILYDLYIKHLDNKLVISPKTDEINKYSLQKTIIPSMRSELNRLSHGN